MAEQQYIMTQKGYDEAVEKLKYLQTVKRQEIVDRISEARSHGDLSENAEYHSAREQQSFNEGRIQELESALSHAQVIDVKSLSGDKVLFGATVEVADEETGDEKKFQIVGQYEANLEKGKISLLSPIAKALIGKQIGDIVDVKTPKGDVAYEILDVQFI